jgi:hypothetical protein
VQRHNHFDFDAAQDRFELLAHGRRCAVKRFACDFDAGTG